MTRLCDECETVAHCLKHGCIPKQQALDKKAEHARELGLDYEPAQPRAWFTVDELNAWADKKLKENPQWAEQPAQQEPVPEFKSPGQRWEDGDDHDSRSKALYKFIADTDFEHCGDSFCFKSGGDGDNGETLMFILDCWFAQQSTSPQPAQREPVAWYDSKTGWTDFHSFKPTRKPSAPDAEWLPLYAAPPAQQEAQAEETVKERTPQERRDAGEWHCPECFTFGHQHRRGCTAAHGIKENT